MSGIVNVLLVVLEEHILINMPMEDWLVCLALLNSICYWEMEDVSAKMGM